MTTYNPFMAQVEAPSQVPAPTSNAVAQVRTDGTPMRANEAVAAFGQEHSHRIIKALEDALSAGAPFSVRLKAAEMVLRADREEVALERADDLADLTKKELVDQIVAMLVDLKRAGIVEVEPPIIEAEVIEVVEQ